jgi:hypothetical protein
MNVRAMEAAAAQTVIWKGRWFVRLFVMTILVAVTVTASQHGAWAQVELKPRGGASFELRAKKIEAQIQIKGAFAATRVLTTFQNEANERIEADFFYTVPDGAVVTGFAYWFGKEKVMARVVEKERAAAIYNAITTRQRDPALIEQINKNTFRARIFPIEPNADLKVEMSWVQTLATDAKGALYTFPLKPAEEGKGTLESLEIKARVLADEGIARVVNNYRLPLVQEESGAQVLTLSQKNYRPPQDLTIRLERAPRALSASLYAAPSGGRDGFFALALTPGQSLKAPRLAINGGAVYGVLPARLPALRAHRTFVVVGRYHGSGAATVALSGFGNDGKTVARRQVVFGTARENNSIATKLWAARQIEFLASAKRMSEKDRERIVELSTRFTLPSRFTSWLAVPKSEWNLYKNEVAWGEIERIGPALAELIHDGKAHTHRARRLRAQFNAACRLVGESPRANLDNYLANLNDNRYARRREKMQQLAANVVDGKRKKQSLRRLKRLARASGESASEYIAAAKSARRRRRLGEVAHALSEEIIAGRDNDARARRLAKRYQEILQRERRSNDWEVADIQRRPNQAYHARAHYLAALLLKEKKSAAPDAQKTADLEAELERASKKAGITPKDVLSYEQNGYDAMTTQSPEASTQAMREYFMRQGDPLISIAAPANAQQVLAVLPSGEIKKLVFNADSKKWEARFDVPTYAAEGEYSIEILIVLPDGQRQKLQMKFHVDVTSPRGAARAALARNDESTRVLRLEFDGDEDTARVLAVAPWGEKIELAPSTQKLYRFFALAPIPEEYSGAAARVQFTLTDRAHNRTTIEVDFTP